MRSLLATAAVSSHIAHEIGADYHTEHMDYRDGPPSSLRRVFCFTAHLTADKDEVGAH